MKKKKLDWSKVKDELCYCDQPKSKHEGARHHLGCKESGCQRFTWAAFLDEKGNKI
jgi:hypothetical protein